MNCSYFISRFVIMLLMVQKYLTVNSCRWIRVDAVPASAVLAGISQQAVFKISVICNEPSFYEDHRL